MSKNINAINSLAALLRGSIQFTHEGTVSFTDPNAELTYNEMISTLLGLAETKASVFIRKVRQQLDESEMVSIALLEGVRKAFDTWYDPDFPFYSVFSKSVDLLFIDYIRKENTAKRKALTSSCSPESMGNSDDPLTLDSFKSIAADPLDACVFKEKVSNISRHQFTEDEKKVLYVLANFKNKEVGQAYAKVFGKDTYDTSLRKRVERIKKTLNEVVTNA